MAPAGTVVATRYHNVICALKLSKPTISLGYAAKNIAVMADAGLSEFCQFANSLDVDLLIKQFTELENRSAELRRTIAERNVANAQLLDEQFAGCPPCSSRRECRSRRAVKPRPARRAEGKGCRLTGKPL